MNTDPGPAEPPSQPPTPPPGQPQSEQPPPTPAANPTPGPMASTAAPVLATGGLERIALEILRQQRSERRWRTFFRLAWLGLVLALIWGLMSADPLSGAATSTPHTALVEVRGEISTDAEASAEMLIGALRSAFEDPGAQAVVLRINSGGGSPVQSGIVNDEILRLKALHGKKVYAVVEEIAASGAYYIAVAADEIYVDKASIVGSIGVLMDGFGFTGLMDKLGVERRLMTAGGNKAALDPFSPLKPEQQAHAQAMLDQIHQQFIAVVRSGRGERLKETPETFSGLFWNGEQAVEMGLADHLGSLEYVAREVVKAENIVDYTARPNVAERLAKRFGAGMGEGAVQALRAMAPLR